MADLKYTIGLDGSQFETQAKSLLGTVGKISAGLVALGAGAAFGGLLRRGLQFNQTMGDSEAAISKVLAQFQGLNEEASKQAAAAAMRQLIELEPRVSGGLADLTAGFMATLAASQSAGMSVEQNIDLVGRFANAMANANVPMEQLATEMRSIVTANIGADSSLAKVLGITNEMAKQAMESGRMYEFLAGKIGKLGEAGDTAGVAFSTLQSAVDQAAGALTQGLFEEVVADAKELTFWVNENRQSFADLGSGLATVARVAADVGAGVKVIVDNLSDMVALIGLMSDGQRMGDAAAAINAARDARLAEAAAAREQAEAVKAVNEARKPAPPAASAPPLAKPKSGAGEGGGASASAAFAEAERLIDAQRRLDDLKRDAALEQMSLGQKIGMISAELARAAEEEATIRADAFGADGGALIAAETRRVELHRELLGLQRQEAAEREREARLASVAGGRAAAPPASAAAPGVRAGRIAGFSRARGQQGRRMGGGLEDFERLQQGEFGAGALSKRVASMMNPAAAAVAVAGTITTPPVQQDKSRTTPNDPVLAELKAIRDELQRIRTA